MHFLFYKLLVRICKKLTQPMDPEKKTLNGLFSLLNMRHPPKVQKPFSHWPSKFWTSILIVCPMLFENKQPFQVGSSEKPLQTVSFKVSTLTAKTRPPPCIGSIKSTRGQIEELTWRDKPKGEIKRHVCVEIQWPINGFGDDFLQLFLFGMILGMIFSSYLVFSSYFGMILGIIASFPVIQWLLKWLEKCYHRDPYIGLWNNPYITG